MRLLLLLKEEINGPLYLEFDFTLETCFLIKTFRGGIGYGPPGPPLTSWKYTIYSTSWHVHFKYILFSEILDHIYVWAAKQRGSRFQWQLISIWPWQREEEKIVVLLKNKTLKTEGRSAAFEGIV